MAWVLWLTVFVRTRWPFVPLVAGAVLAVIGMDYLLMLVGAWQVVVRRGRRTAMWTALGTAVVVAFTVVRDSLRAPLDSVAGGLLATTADGDGVHEPQRWAVVALLVFLAVFGYGLTVGLAYLIRSHRTELRASSVAGSARAQARAATTELNRRSERDRFAQEVHDTLAHRLSLLSLQSGALQVRTQRIAPELSRAAGDVQAQAHASMQDLRVLLGELTGPDEAVGPPSAATLRTIPELVRSTRAAGARVNAVVLVDSSTAPTDVLDHAAYRIVQECLTNAVKHAPGQAVDLYVSAEAGSGVQIRASNPLPGARAGGAAAPGGAALAGAPGGPGMPGGAGLDGIRERAKVLGGTSRIGPDQGVFAVDVFLPWSSRTPPRS